MKKKQPTSTETVYLPFYMLLDHLEGAPSEAFVPCYVLECSQQPIGGKRVNVCKISLFAPDSGKVVYLPDHFVILEEHLLSWGHKIANWFIASAKKHCDTLNDTSDGLAAIELTNALINVLSKDGETVANMPIGDAHQLIHQILADPSRYVVIRA